MILGPIIWKCEEHGIHGSMTIARYRNGIGVTCDLCDSSAFISRDELKRIQGRTVVFAKDGTYGLEG